MSTPSVTSPAPPVAPAEPTLIEVLGGRRGAVDATVPTLAFVLALLVARRYAPVEAVAISLAAGAGSAIAVAGWRAVRRHKPRAALMGLLPVLGGAAIAAWTGRPEDFFLVRIVANAASAVAWAVSVWIRWPLLGVVAGAALRQRATWRRDPELLRAYSRACWWWVWSFTARSVILAALWLASATVALGIAQVALSWPLMSLVLMASWRTVRTGLPEGHPGLLHPRPVG